MNCNMTCLSPSRILTNEIEDQKVAHYHDILSVSTSLQCRKHTFIQYGLLHGKLSPVALQIKSINEGETLPHLAKDQTPV